MELNLATKPKPVIQRALRALLQPLQDHWGDPQAFRAAAIPILVREAGPALADAKEASALAEQALRVVIRLRAAHFRPTDNPTQLDTVYKNLEQAAGAGPHSTLRQSALWLAYRLHQAALHYLRSPEAHTALGRCWNNLESRKDLILKAAADPNTFVLDRFELVLAEAIVGSLTANIAPFNLHMLAGFFLEKARATARVLPELDTLESVMPTQTKESRLLGLLAEPARAAELNEARLRFSKLAADESTKRFDEFKLQLMRAVVQVAPYAPMGFEKFCQALETVLYPYPAPLEWIRSFAKPIYNNAVQSEIFDDCQTPQSVNQRYQAFRKGKQGNTVILELAKALASTKSKAREQEERQSFMMDLDLAKEFQWPTSLDELKAQWAAKAGS